MSSREPLYQPVATDSPPQPYPVERTKAALETSFEMSGKKNWQLHPGKNRFCCDGRVMMGRQAGIFYLTLGLIFVGMGFFFGFDAPYLWNNVNPILPILAAFQVVFVLSTLFKTAFSDPGVIPRATPAEAAFIERSFEAQENAPGYFRGAPRTKEVSVNGQIIKLKYCLTCKIFRPPRASHCSVCDNCVERFDHHCPWVGNCVGLRNYKFFYLFLVSISVLCIYVFGCTIAHLVLRSKDSGSFLTAVKESPGSVIVLIIDVISFLTIIGLMGFHSYLIASAQTTNEDIKGSFSTRRGQEVVNPYSYGGMFANCCHILCAPIQPSMLHLREYRKDPPPAEEMIARNGRVETLTTTTRHVAAPSTNQNTAHVQDTAHAQNTAHVQEYSPYANTYQARHHPHTATGGELRNSAQPPRHVPPDTLQPGEKYPTAHYNANASLSV